jgi:hypothetical protein
MNQHFLVLFSLCLLLLACSESENRTYPPPSIAFATGEGFVSTDTTLDVNESVRIGIESSSNSDVGLTLFHTCIDVDGELTPIDSGLNSPALSIRKTLTKGTAEREKWSFYTRDRDGRQSDTLSIILYKGSGSAYGPILRYDTLMLGAQDNPLPGMLSLPDGEVHSMEEAAGNQANIWLLYYYDNLTSDKNTIASPGANIDAALYDLSAWTVKNTTRFLEIESIPENAFLSSGNDSLILKHTFEFASGKRKAKQLTEGDFYSIVTENTKRGIIRILHVEGEKSGSVKFQMILQE